MRIFISTGEVSGDLQGAILIRSLQKQATIMNVDLEIVALGGERMAAAGATLLANTAGIGSIGLLESLPFIMPTLTIQSRAKKYLQQYPPDLSILIDYPGPNLVIGEYVKKHLPQVPIAYYIAPQDWVIPRLGNAKRLAKFTALLLAIFPEEANYYKNIGIPVAWVGHPLLDRMAGSPSKEKARKILGIPQEQIAIALFPASRQQELKYLLPILCQAAKLLQEKIPRVHFWIPVALPKYRQAIEEMVSFYGLQATLLENSNIEAIAAADLAITKSGTVNLEIALLNIPQVVIYRINPITIWIAEKILKLSVKFISPVNLILSKEIVPELLQIEANPERIASESLDLLFNSHRQQQLQQDYQQMRSCLGEIGVGDRVAQKIFQLLIT
jgi:lipid-A-disaccharide synthase